MDKTAIQTAESRLSAATRAAPTTRAYSAPLPIRLLKELAALRITVVLMALSILLVFFGTLAQMDEGIWTVLNKYFRTGIAWIPFQIFVRFGQVFFTVPTTTTLPGRFPYPGGWLLGGLLLVNLLAAHAIRFRLTWKRSGIFLIHAGLIVMMLSEVVAGVFAIEGNMVIEEGSSSNYLQHNRYAELAVIDASDSQTDDVVVVPDSMLRKKEVIHHEDLPFDVEPLRYLQNSDLARIKEGEKPK